MKPIILRKKGSPHAVRFTPDPKDLFFTNIEILKVRTGEVKCSHYILSSDVAQWQDQYSRDGFIAVKEEVQS